MPASVSFPGPVQTVFMYSSWSTAESLTCKRPIFPHFSNTLLEMPIERLTFCEEQSGFEEQRDWNWRETETEWSQQRLAVRSTVLKIGMLREIQGLQIVRPFEWSSQPIKNSASVLQVRDKWEKWRCRFFRKRRTMQDGPRKSALEGTDFRRWFLNSCAHKLMDFKRWFFNRPSHEFECLKERI